MELLVENTGGFQFADRLSTLLYVSGATLLGKATYSFFFLRLMIDGGCFSYGPFLCYDGVAGGLDTHVVPRGG